MTDDPTQAPEDPSHVPPVFVQTDEQRAELEANPDALKAESRRGRVKRPAAEGVGMRWPWWLGIAVVVAALVAAVLEGIVLLTINNVSPHAHDAWVTRNTQWIGLGQDALWITVALAIPFFVVRSLGARDFGLVFPRPVRGIVVFVGFAFAWIAISAIYSSVFGLHNTDNKFLPDTSYRGGAGGVSDFAYAMVFVVAAPIAEELIFRSLLFRSIATGLGGVTGKWGGLIAGVLVSGGLFGAAHAGGGQNDFIPLLITFGCLLAIAYQISQSLLVTIALHSTNNAIAVASLGGRPHTWLLIVLIAGPFIAVGLARLLGLLVDHLPRRLPPAVQLLRTDQSPARHVDAVAPGES